MTHQAAAPSRAPIWVLAASCLIAAVAWLSLTTVPLISEGAVIVLTVAVVTAAGVVAPRQQGRRRLLALLGATVAVLPLAAVLAFLALSDG